MHSFVREVAALSFEHCFNPYSDRCPVHDVPDAPQRRSTVLSAMLEQAERRGVDAIWIGRDLGYRGGRRTGLALTDDVHVQRHADRWGVSVELSTMGAAMSERTAAVIWSVLEGVKETVFLWNVFPLHPHEAGNPFSNRQHNVKERRAGEEVLVSLIKLLKPRRLIAIGNDAAAAALRPGLSMPVLRVRHPSYGGQREFLEMTALLYGKALDLQHQLF